MESDKTHIGEIQRMLPQRYPFLLVDRVISVDLEQQSIVCYKNITINEHFFMGHFPQVAIMPGVLILEAMAQSAGILKLRLHESKCQEKDRRNDQSLYLFAGADAVKFRRAVVPGDRLELQAKTLASKQHITKFSCQARVEGELVCSAEITCAKKEILN